MEVFQAWLFNFEITQKHCNIHRLFYQQMVRKLSYFMLHLLALVHNVKHICKFPYCGPRPAPSLFSSMLLRLKPFTVTRYTNCFEVLIICFVFDR